MYHSIPLSICSPLLAVLSRSIQTARTSLGFCLWLPHRRALLILRPHHFKWCRHRQGDVYKCVYIPLLLLVPCPLSCSALFISLQCLHVLKLYIVIPSLPPLRSEGVHPYFVLWESHPEQCLTRARINTVVWWERREGVVVVSTLLTRLWDTGV